MARCNIITAGLLRVFRPPRRPATHSRSRSWRKVGDRGRFQAIKTEVDLDQYRVRRYDAWYEAWYAPITLVMPSAAF